MSEPEPGPGVKGQWPGLGGEGRGSPSPGRNHLPCQGKPPVHSDLNSTPKRIPQTNSPSAGCFLRDFQAAASG